MAVEQSDLERADGPDRHGKAEQIRRRSAIGEMLSRAVPSARIVARVTHEFKIGERQARADLAAVRKLWAAEITKEEPHRRARLLATLDHVVAEAIEDRAWGAAVAGLREISRICGLNAPIVYKVKTGALGNEDTALVPLPAGDAEDE